MSSLSFQLPLAVAPEVRDPEMFGELLRVYNSVKLLAAKLDEYTGMTPTENGSLTLEQSLSLGRFMKFEATCNRDVSSGRLVTIMSTAKVGMPGTGGILHTATMRAISIGDYLRDEVGTFMLKGLITFTGEPLTPGSHYIHQEAGYMIAGTPDATHQGVGFALDSNHLWFEPDIHWTHTPA